MKMSTQKMVSHGGFLHTTPVNKGDIHIYQVPFVWAPDRHPRTHSCVHSHLLLIWIKLPLLRTCGYYPWFNFWISQFSECFNNRAFRPVKSSTTDSVRFSKTVYNCRKDTVGKNPHEAILHLMDEEAALGKIWDPLLTISVFQLHPLPFLSVHWIHEQMCEVCPYKINRDSLHLSSTNSTCECK